MPVAYPVSDAAMSVAAPRSHAARPDRARPAMRSKVARGGSAAAGLAWVVAEAKERVEGAEER